MTVGHKSIQLWHEYGEYILMATAYNDYVLEKGSGIRIVDADGNEMIDLESGQICSLVGHNHPKLIERITKQMQQLMHTGTGFLSKPVFEAAKKMANITPGGLKKSIFLSTGAEANECAFRIVKAATGRRGLVGFTKGYAGLTLATTNVGLSARKNSLDVPGTFKILAPECKRCLFERKPNSCNFFCLDVSFEFLKSHCENEIAAFIVEPILSVGGMIFPPKGYFKYLKEKAREIGALIIADEAQTGMGRTGPWFAMEEHDVVPDVLVSSKGIGGGFPVSCVTVTDGVAAAASERFRHFSSHQCDPAAATAVAAVIDIIERENLRENARNMGSYFVEGLKELEREFPFFCHARGKGLMIGLDICSLNNKKISERDIAGWFQFLCRENGVHVKPIAKGKVLRILPPLNICRNDIDEILKIFKLAANAIHSGKVNGKPPLSENRYTKAFECRQRKSKLSRAAEYVWRSSPRDLFTRIISKENWKN